MVQVRSVGSVVLGAGYITTAFIPRGDAPDLVELGTQWITLRMTVEEFEFAVKEIDHARAKEADRRTDSNSGLSGEQRGKPASERPSGDR